MEIRRQRTGARVRHLELWAEQPAKVREQDLVNLIVGQIRDETRVVALTWVYSTTGVKLPLEEIAKPIAKLNESRKSDDDKVLLCVDGAHGFGVEDITFDKLGCDFLVAGCHKWLFGPRGTGVIYARKVAWSALTPTIPSDLKEPGERVGIFHSPGGVLAYEHQWALAEAFRYHIDLGKDWVQERTHALAGRLKEGLKNQGVHVVTPMDATASAGIVSCDMQNRDPHDAVQWLFERYAIRATVSWADVVRGKRTYLRFSPSILNSDEEIDLVLAAVEQFMASG